MIKSIAASIALASLILVAPAFAEPDMDNTTVPVPLAMSVVLRAPPKATMSLPGSLEWPKVWTRWWPL